jgi:hypothetical protein
VFIPVTGNLALLDPCTDKPGVALNWQVTSSNAYDVSITWWVVGGKASGGPLVVRANSSISFETPIDGALPNTLAIMWVDPADSQTKIITAPNTGVACTDILSATPSATSTPEALIPVTGIELPTIFRESMLLNLGIGVFGFALILLGVGIKLDRNLSEEDEYEDDDEYED